MNGSHPAHHARRSTFQHWCILVFVAAWLQHKRWSLGRSDRSYGLDAETGMFMLLYIDLAVRE